MLKTQLNELRLRNSNVIIDRGVGKRPSVPRSFFKSLLLITPADRSQLSIKKSVHSFFEHVYRPIFLWAFLFLK